MVAKSQNEFDAHQSSIGQMDPKNKSGYIKGGEKYRKNRGKQVQRIPLTMTKHTIDRIIYPVQTKRGLKYKKPQPEEN